MAKFIDEQSFLYYVPNRCYNFTVKSVSDEGNHFAVHCYVDGRLDPRIFFYRGSAKSYDSALKFFNSIGVEPFKWEMCRGRNGLCTLQTTPPKDNFKKGYIIISDWVSQGEREYVSALHAKETYIDREQEGDEELMKPVNAVKTPCKYSDVIHDSKTEARRCEELHEALRRGEIRNLQEHVHYNLIAPYQYPWEVKKEGGVDYTSDFNYQERNDKGEWIQIVEDVKSSYTAKFESYAIRRKLFKSTYCQGRNDIIFREHRA